MYVIKQNKVGKFYFTINDRSGNMLAKSHGTFLTLPGVKKAITSCQITSKSSKTTEEIKEWKH